MSILDRDPSNDQPPPASQAAERLIRMTKNTYDQMVMAFNHGSEVFWSNRMGATPEEVSAALGSDAKEVFYLHARLGELIGLVKPEAIAEGLSVVGEFTMNEDGTVTVIPPTTPPPPEPEPAPEPAPEPEPEPEPEPVDPNA
jgi:hypothetical protein